MQDTHIFTIPQIFTKQSHHLKKIYANTRYQTGIMIAINLFIIRHFNETAKQTCK